MTPTIHSPSAPAHRKRRRALWLLGLAPLAAFGGLMAFLDAWGSVDRARRSDCIIVLGARVHRGGVIGQSLRARTTHAVSLYKRGTARKLIFTGGLGDHPPEESRAAAQLARKMGVAPSDIELELSSTSTWENATNAVAIARRRGWKSAVVVSDGFHLWRATRCFSRLGFQVSSSPCSSDWMAAHGGTRFWYDAREAVAVLRDLTFGPR